MKTKLTNTALTLMMWLGLANAAYATTGAGEENISIFVWIFLALCALIIIGQLIPALLVLTGFAKGLKKEGSKKTAESAPNTAAD
jgi:hypothetical protein